MFCESLKQEIPKLIDYLVEKDDQQKSKESLERFQKALNFEPVDRLPITFYYPAADDATWKPLPNRLIYQDPPSMLYNELVSAWNLHITDKEVIQDDLPVTIRPNWGTVTVASLLGILPEQRDDQTPWIKRGDREITLEEINSLDVDISEAPWVNNILETYSYYHEILSKYPEFEKIVTITLPDLQGPFDSLEQVMGEQLFIDMVLDPDTVTEALMKVAKLQLECLRLFTPYCTEPYKGYSHQHGTMLKGNLLIRNDSVVMISSDMYKEIVSPADLFLIEQVNGGSIHSCGKIDHATDVMFDLQGLQSFDFGQPYMNDMDKIYQKAVEKQVPLIRVQPTPEELTTGSILDRYPTGVTLTYQAKSRDEAKELHESYRRATNNKGV